MVDAKLYDLIPRFSMTLERLGLVGNKDYQFMLDLFNYWKPNE
jgi:hypothetical protein